jgi:hypothetical protein
MGQHARLAGARAGEHQIVTRGRGHRLALRFVESVDQMGNVHRAIVAVSGNAPRRCSVAWFLSVAVRITLWRPIRTIERHTALRKIDMARLSRRWISGLALVFLLSFVFPRDTAHAQSSPHAISSAQVPGYAIVPEVGPIDLRRYVFSEPEFSRSYPTFPQTSYDLAFDPQTHITDFVRDQLAGIRRAVDQEFVPAFVPMRDGGAALVQYDKQTSVVRIVEISDGQGGNLPIDHQRPQDYLPNSGFHFVKGSRNANVALKAFTGWASRNGIPVDMPADDWSAIECRGRPAHAQKLRIMCIAIPH